MPILTSISRILTGTVAGALRFLAPPPERAAAERLFAAILAQARRPVFYLDFGVADTIDGRFDILAVHAVIVSRRLRSFGRSGEPLGRAFLEAMFANFDGAMREQGISDMGVPRRMKSMASAFFGRAEGYDSTLDATGNLALEAAVKRNLYRGRDVAADCVRVLAQYLREFENMLGGLGTDKLLAGEIALPVPRGVAT